MEWCLAYGSLMDPEDTFRTLQEEVPMLAAVVPGWRRDWNIASSRRYVCKECSGITPGQPTALNLVEEKGSQLAGVLLQLKPEHLELLDQREDSYQRRLFSPANLRLFKPSTMPAGRFWLYQAKPETSLEESVVKQAFIPGAYQELIHKAANHWGEEFARLVELGDKQAAWPVRPGLDFLHDRNAQLPDCKCL